MEPEVGMEQLIKGLPFEERVPVLALKNYFDQRSSLDQQQEMKVQLVKRKYAEKVKPLLDRAAELIQGAVPKPEEVTQIQQYLKPGEKVPQLKGKTIQNYWVGALQNSPIERYMNQKDQNALESLLNIYSLNDAKEINSVSYKFVFKANAYYQETTAIRKLNIVDGRPASLEGDVLTPKPGNWLTHEARKINNKSTGQNKVVPGKKKDSFFDIFINWSGSENPKELAKCAKIFEDLREVVQDSYSFFLGLYDLDVSEDAEEYDDDDVSEK